MLRCNTNCVLDGRVPHHHPNRLLHFILGAASFGRTELVEPLIENGADVSAGDNNGMPPFGNTGIDLETTLFVASLFAIELDEKDE